MQYLRTQHLQVIAEAKKKKKQKKQKKKEKRKAKKWEGVGK